MTKKLLRSVVKNGNRMDHHEAVMVQTDWVKIFGSAGCDCYPYITEDEMLKDLLDHYTI